LPQKLALQKKKNHTLKKMLGCFNPILGQMWTKKCNLKM